MPRVEMLLCSEFFSDLILTALRDVAIKTCTSIQLQFTYLSLVRADSREPVFQACMVQKLIRGIHSLYGEIGDKGDAELDRSGRSVPPIDRSALDMSLIFKPTRE